MITSCGAPRRLFFFLLLLNYLLHIFFKKLTLMIIFLSTRYVIYSIVEWFPKNTDIVLLGQIGGSLIGPTHICHLACRARHIGHYMLAIGTRWARNSNLNSGSRSRNNHWPMILLLYPWDTPLKETWLLGCKMYVWSSLFRFFYNSLTSDCCRLGLFETSCHRTRFRCGSPRIV